MLTRSLSLFCACLFLLTPLLVLAHGTGSSYESVVNGYSVDVGYSAPEPEVGEAVSFDFSLTKEGKDVAFSDVWVRIESPNGGSVFAGGIHNAELTGSRMSYAFPAEGKYLITMRFEQPSGSLVEAQFPLTAHAAHTEPSPIPLIALYALLVGVVLGVGAALLYARLRQTV